MRPSTHRHRTRSPRLARVTGLAAWTVLTISAAVVVVDLELLPEVTVVGRSLLPTGAAHATGLSPGGGSALPPVEPAALPPAEPPEVRGMPPAPPSAIEVPSLGVASPLVRLGIDDSGVLQVPGNYARAGWYAGGPYPGKANGPPAVIVGHVDSLIGPAVFYRLREIEEGAEIRVTRADGSAAIFRVVDTRQYPKSALPADQVYARRQPAELVLITCTGEFDDQTRSYLDNFVVTARLDREASGVPR